MLLHKIDRIAESYAKLSNPKIALFTWCASTIALSFSVVGLIANLMDRDQARVLRSIFISIIVFIIQYFDSLVMKHLKSQAESKNLDSE